MRYISIYYLILSHYIILKGEPAHQQAGGTDSARGDLDEDGLEEDDHEEDDLDKDDLDEKAKSYN